MVELESVTNFLRRFKTLAKDYCKLSVCKSISLSSIHAITLYVYAIIVLQIYCQKHVAKMTTDVEYDFSSVEAELLGLLCATSKEDRRNGEVHILALSPS